MSDSQPTSATSEKALSDAGDDPGSPNTTPDSPDDISRWQCHIDLQDFGEGLQEAARATFPNTNKSRYSKVSVLMLCWEDEDPNLPVSIEIERLQNVFTNLYHFETQIWKIPDQNCHAKLNRKILDFVTTDDNIGEELFIVYYAGHARLTRDRLLAWTSWRNDKKSRCPLVQWSGIQNVLEQAESDVLILLDCCHAGTANASEGNGVTELISACAYNARANGVGYYSFTTELIIELEELSFKPSFTIAELHRNVFCRIQGRRPEDGRERHPAPIHISLTQDRPQYPRSIQLSVRPGAVKNLTVKPQNELTDSEATPSVSSPPIQVPRILIAIRLKNDFQVGELFPDLFKEWLRNIPTVAEEVKVEAGFGSFSSLILVSIPFSLCAYLRNDPAIIRLGPITTSNLMSSKLSTATAQFHQDIKTLDHQEEHPQLEMVVDSKREAVGLLNWLTSLCLHIGRVFLSLEGLTMAGMTGSNLWSFVISMGPVIIFDVALPIYHGGSDLMHWVKKFHGAEAAILKVKQKIFTPQQMAIIPRRSAKLYLLALVSLSIFVLAIQIPDSFNRSIWNKISAFFVKVLQTRNQNVLGLAALGVSLVALATTALQVLQQFYSSTEGYRHCSEAVMGLWSRTTHTRFRLSEFRVEVFFETPVIFLSRPENLKGPVFGQPIQYIDGTERSYRETLVREPGVDEANGTSTTPPSQSTDDERASWVTLLSTLQREERESRAWDAERRNDSQRRSLTTPEYQLTVGLQKKIRSWEFMPASVNKPYATTSMSHLIEVAAMLGIYWRVFNQETWNLKAEGNGLVLTSTTASGLGVMFIFDVAGVSKFQETRVIPTHHLKELCFGSVTTILLEPETTRCLHFGKSKLHETLRVLGLHSQDLRRYDENHGHLFSVSFEIIAMLSVVFRLRGSNFKRIPNPTQDPWRHRFSKLRLMKIYMSRLKEGYINGGIPGSPRHKHITSHWKHWIRITNKFEGMADLYIDIDFKEDLHDAIDSSTTYLQSKDSVAVIEVVAFHLKAVLASLGDLAPQLNAPEAKKENILVDFYFDTILAEILAAGSSASTVNENAIVSDQRSQIWISLVFRMLCWLLLHDFDEEDVQMVPPDLKGSRMPVYIG